MRKSKEIVLGDNIRVRVQELTLKEIRETLTNIEDKSTVEVANIILQKIFNLSLADFENFTPSEIEVLLKEVKGVNESFLKIPDLLNYLGIGDVLTQLKKNLQSSIQLVFSNMGQPNMTSGTLENVNANQSQMANTLNN